MHISKKFFIHKGVWAALAVLLLLGLTLLSLCVGSVNLSLAEVFGALADVDSPAARIVLYVRLPRTLAALVAGAALAAAGVLLQTVLNNPLASGSVIGVNAGSGMMVVLAAAFFPTAFIARSLFAFVGAFGAAMAVYAFAVRTGASKSTVILSGIAVSAFLSAIIDLVVTLFPHVGIDRLAFTVGGFSGVGMRAVVPAAVLTAVGLIGAVLLSSDYNVLRLGVDVAASLGLRVRLVRFSAVVLAALLCGAAISLGGLIGFVGLIVPNLLRLLFGSDCRILLPLSAAFGASFTMLCDLIARTAFAPYELPVGILLSFIGAPFFLFLLLQRRKGRRYGR
ncbi:MAG: iron ABC transporter permease [Clostridia bacterium]|jgi:iron complex transport system permease protein|nr:iron ABC transporter permease [Clostridia bacterium]